MKVQRILSFVNVKDIFAGCEIEELMIRPIKRIVLFPVHLKQFPWVGRKVFLFFILYNFACKIHGVGGKKFGFNTLTYITLFFFRHKKNFLFRLL